MSAITNCERIKLLIPPAVEFFSLTQRREALEVKRSRSRDLEIADRNAYRVRHRAADLLLLIKALLSSQ